MVDEIFCQPEETLLTEVNFKLSTFVLKILYLCKMKWFNRTVHLRCLKELSVNKCTQQKTYMYYSYTINL